MSARLTDLASNGRTGSSGRSADIPRRSWLTEEAERRIQEKDDDDDMEEESVTNQSDILTVSDLHTLGTIKSGTADHWKPGPLINRVSTRDSTDLDQPQLALSSSDDQNTVGDIRTLATGVQTLNHDDDDSGVVRLTVEDLARHYAHETNDHNNPTSGDPDSFTDIHTVVMDDPAYDDQVTIDTNDRHAAPLGQPQYYQEPLSSSSLPATTAASGVGLYEWNENNEGVQLSADEELPSTPERSNKVNKAVAFWSRLSPIKRSNSNNNNNADKAALVTPPPPLGTMPTAEEDVILGDADDEEHGPQQYHDSNSSLPGMIVVSSRGGGNSDRPYGVSSDDNHNSNNMNMANNDKLSQSNSAGTVSDMPSVWKQKLCGVRADRLIVLMMIVLLLAVAVIVGAIIMNTTSSKNSSSSSSNALSGEQESERVTLTRTPTVMEDGAIATAPPSVSSVASTSAPSAMPNGKPKPPPKDSVTPVPSEKQQPPTVTPSTLPPVDEPVPAEPPAAEATLSPAEAPPTDGVEDEEWDVENCGGDSASGTFFGGTDVGVRDCNWLAAEPSDGPLFARLCEPGSAPHRLCRETCRNCDPPVNDDETATSTFPPMETDDDTEDNPPPPPSEEPEMPAPEPTDSPVAEPDPTEPPVTEPDPTKPPTTEPDPTEPPTAESDATEPPAEGDAEDDDGTEIPTPESGSSRLVEIIVEAWPDADFDSDGSDKEAYDWLFARYDAGDYSEDDNLVQIWTLAVFAFATGIDRWDSSDGWLDSSDECTWFGVSCDSSGSVAEIDLSDNGLNGNLPRELELFADSLEILTVSENELTGDILPRLTGLTNLQVLKLDNNDVSGSIPDDVDRWQDMRILWLDHNSRLGGEIPTSMEDMSSLVELVIHYTAVSGTLPSGVCDIASLETLTLDCYQIESDCWTRCLFRCGGDTGIDCDGP